MPAHKALWYKAWRETRWRFLVGGGLMACSTAATVLAYPRVLALVPLVTGEAGGELGRRVLEAAELVRSYPGYVWSQAFRTNLTQLATLFAVLLGAAGFPGAASAATGVQFTLSLPVSRQQLLGVRLVVGLAEVGALTLVPALLLPVLSPVIGATYGVGAALAHAGCLFAASTVFFSLALLLSLVFDDPWKPWLTALAVALVLALCEPLLATPSWTVYRVMSGETYFRTGHLPWGGVLASAAVSAALSYAALRKLAHRDF